MLAPEYTVLRANTLGKDLFEITEFVKAAIGTEYLVMPHEKIPDVIIISLNEKVESPIPCSKPVIVDAACGNAVLRGSDVFIPAVMAMHPDVMANDEVSVFSDASSRIVKGSKVYLHNLPTHFVFLGNGLSVYARDQVYIEKPQKGLGVKMTQRVMPAPALNGVLTDLIFPQNFPSIVCAHVLNPKPGHIVLDMCAAPGGKTCHLATLMKNTGTLVAIDRSESKVLKIQENAQKWRLNVVRCFIGDSSSENFIGCKLSNGSTSFSLCENMFDKVLLDAPCSGLGKRPFLERDYIGPPGKFFKYQRKFIRNAIKLLKVGGTLVYSTCTTLLEENENQVAWVLENCPQLELVSSEPNFRKPGRPESSLSEKERSMVQYFPPEVSTDYLYHPCEGDTIGFFIAKFLKISN